MTGKSQGFSFDHPPEADKYAGGAQGFNSPPLEALRLLPIASSQLAAG